MLGIFTKVGSEVMDEDFLEEIDDQDNPNFDTDEEQFQEPEDEDYEEDDDFIGEDDEI
jgi:hypothetical protein